MRKIDNIFNNVHEEAKPQITKWARKQLKVIFLNNIWHISLRFKYIVDLNSADNLSHRLISEGRYGVYRERFMFNSRLRWCDIQHSI